MGDVSADEDVELIIKRSTSANMQDLRLTMRLSSTLADVKARLQTEYEDRPDPACVTVRGCISPSHGLASRFSRVHRSCDISESLSAQVIHAGHVLRNDAEALRTILNMVRTCAMRTSPCEPARTVPRGMSACPLAGAWLPALPACRRARQGWHRARQCHSPAAALSRPKAQRTSTGHPRTPAACTGGP